MRFRVLFERFAPARRADGRALDGVIARCVKDETEARFERKNMFWCYSARIRR